MKKLIQTTLIVLAFVGGALSLRAHEGGESKSDQKKELMLAHLKDRLGLTDDQAKKLQDVMENHRKADKPIQRELRDARAKLGDQLEDKAADADLKATLDRIDKAEKDLRIEGDKHHDAMNAILTVQQRAKMAVMKGRHPGGPMGMKRPGMRGMKGGKGDPKMGEAPDKKDAVAGDDDEDEGPGEGGPPQEE